MARGSKLGPWRVKVDELDGQTNTSNTFEVENVAGTTIKIADYNGNLFNATENVLSTITKNAKLVVGRVVMPNTGQIDVDLSGSLSSITVGGAVGFVSALDGVIAATRDAGEPIIIQHRPLTANPARLSLYGQRTDRARASVAATLTYFAVGQPA